MVLMNDQPFYSEGLRFSCKRCSACCRYESGYVFLSKTDVDILAGALQIGYNEFLNRYCRQVNVYGGEYISLKEKTNFDCIFWDKICTVYQWRPLHCRLFPFWSSILESASSWALAGRDCPGINSGAIHSEQEIETCLKQRKMEKLIIKNTGDYK